MRCADHPCRSVPAWVCGILPNLSKRQPDPERTRLAGVLAHRALGVQHQLAALPCAKAHANPKAHGIDSIVLIDPVPGRLATPVPVGVGRKPESLGHVAAGMGFKKEDRGLRDAGFCRADHPLARANSVSWQDVVSYPWAFTAIQARFAEMVPVPFDKAGQVDPETGIFNPAIRVETFEAIRAAVRNGNSIGMCSPRFVHQDIASGELALIDLFEPWMQISYGLIWRRASEPRGALKAFADVLVETQRDRDHAFSE